MENNLLYSRIEGEGNPKKLVIIHGFLGLSDNWKTLSTQYANQGFEVHAVEMRNHGKSFHSDVFNYEVMVQDVIQYLNHYQLTKISLIGHSMGGKVTMLLATNYPEFIDKLIIADIGPKYYPPHHQTILAALNAVDFSKVTSRNDVENTFSSYINDFGVKQFLLKNLYRKTPTEFAFRFNLESFNKNIEEIGKSLPFENHYFENTLFLRGDRSDYILDADFETIYHHFPKATIKTIKNAGHWIHAENPIDFFEETIRFISSDF